MIFVFETMQRTTSQKETILRWKKKLNGNEFDKGYWPYISSCQIISNDLVHFSTIALVLDYFYAFQTLSE